MEGELAWNGSIEGESPVSVHDMTRDCLGSMRWKSRVNMGGRYFQS